MKYLAIDIGNTFVKFGLFKNEEPLEMTFGFPTVSLIAHENIEGELLPKLVTLGDLDGIAIASVVPDSFWQCAGTYRVGLYVRKHDLFILFAKRPDPMVLFPAHRLLAGIKIQCRTRVSERGSYHGREFCLLYRPFDHAR